LGGLLTLVSWRLIFVINVPVGAVALVLLARSAPSPRRRVRFDWVGQVTAVAAMGGLTFGAIEAGAVGIGAPRVLGAFVVAVVALVVFILAEARIPHPMVPLGLFRSRNVAIANAVGFAFVVGYFGLPFVMSLYLQQLRGLTPAGTGLVFAPMMLTGLVLTPFSARIVERVGARVLVVGGLAAMTAGLAALAFAPPATPFWVLAALMVLVGLAGPLTMPPTMAVLLNSVPGHQAGTASGVFNTSRQVGGALAVAVFGALLAQPAGFGTGMRTSLLIAATVAALAGGFALLLARPTHTQPAPTGPELAEAAAT
jgi:MFS family permease